MGTLGRQGSTHIFRRMRKLLHDRNVDERSRGGAGGRSAVLFLMAELNPKKIATISGIDVSRGVAMFSLVCAMSGSNGVVSSITLEFIDVQWSSLLSINDLAVFVVWCGCVW